MKCVRTAALAALTVLAGCGSDEDRIPLVRVTGTITRNSKPMANAKVSFIPDVGNKYSTPSVNETGPEGNYMLRFKGRTGVSAGKYKVVVTPAIDLPAGAKIPEAFKDDPVMAQMALGIGVGPDNGKVAGVAKKKEPTKSEFDAQIEEKDSSREFDFDVKG